MEIEYLDAGVHRAVHRDDQPCGWSEGEIARLRLIIQCLQASRYTSDVLSLRSLRVRQDRHDLERASTQLSVDRTVSVRFKDGDGSITAIVDIVDHRTDVAG
jgi:hypothetical protein